MKDEDKLIAEVGTAEAREEIARLQMAFDTCTDIDPNADSIDSQVARKVMKWQYIDRRKAGWGTGKTVWLTQSAYSPTFSGFSPSTDNSDAWRVVDEIIGSATPSSLHFLLWRDDFGWTARFFDGGEFMVEESAKTREVAICLAALKAVDARAARPVAERQGEAR